ncbi:hypothetical protein SAMN05428987_5009 [Paenibacillus sp. CF095]|nr:hypothetical protein SAMN05428987_5009 [Paenibacillus sp. CF095]
MHSKHVYGFFVLSIIKKLKWLLRLTSFNYS